MRGFDNYCYKERLATLSLDNFERRRLRFELILLYTILFGQTDMTLCTSEFLGKSARFAYSQRPVRFCDCLSVSVQLMTTGHT